MIFGHVKYAHDGDGTVNLPESDVEAGLVVVSVAVAVAPAAVAVVGMIVVFTIGEVGPKVVPAVVVEIMPRMRSAGGGH